MISVLCLGGLPQHANGAFFNLRGAGYLLIVVFSRKFESPTISGRFSIKIIKWYGIKTIKLNDQNALEISYLRQLDDNPYVAVRMYYFENKHREHFVTVPYKLRDEKVWTPLFIKSLKSLEIINR